MKHLKLSLLVAFCVITLLSATGTIKPGYDIGDTVADFRLKNVDNNYVALSDFKEAKGVIVIFDCNTCPYSKAYNERIIALNKKYEPLGFPVVAINANDPNQSPGDSFDAMIEHAKKSNYSFPYLIDDSQKVARTFGATNTPHVFVLSKNKEAFTVAYIGGIDNNTKDANAADRRYVEEAVNNLLDGKNVSTPKTKAIGCGIKWKNV